MLKFFKISIILITFFVINIHAFSQTTKIMSYNIRYDNANDGINKWDNRKAEVYNLIERYKPAIIGIQEGLHHQITYLNSSLTHYKFIGVGRADGKLKGEFNPIFYNTSIFSVIKTKTFWLSKHSDTISVGWDAALKRICTYALFENNITRERFWVFNTHFDHIGVKARELSAKLILNKIESLNKDGLPVIFMGDLNSEPTSKPIKILND